MLLHSNNDAIGLCFQVAPQVNTAPTSNPSPSGPIPVPPSTSEGEESRTGAKKKKQVSNVGMWEGAKPSLAESGLVCSANAAVLYAAFWGGNAHIVGLRDPGYRRARAPR